MRAAKAKQVLQDVERNYSAIAEQFSKTRQYAWDDFSLFLPYLRDNSSILDVGCGNGRLLDFFHANHCAISYTGVDVATPFLQIAQETHPDFHFVHGSLPGPLPFPDQSFDISFAIAVFHHIPKPFQLASARELFRVTRNSGRIFVSVWNLFQKRFRWHRFRAFSRSIYTFSAYGFRDLFIPWSDSGVQRYCYAFRPQELRDIFTQAGFQCEQLLFLNRGQDVHWKCSSNIWLVARRP